MDTKNKYSITLLAQLFISNRINGKYCATYKKSLTYPFNLPTINILYIPIFCCC